MAGAPEAVPAGRVGGRRGVAAHHLRVDLPEALSRGDRARRGLAAGTRHREDAFQLGQQIPTVAFPEQDDAGRAEGGVAGHHGNAQVQAFPNRDGISVGEGGPDDHVGFLEEAQAPLVRDLAEAERMVAQPTRREQRPGLGSDLPAHEDGAQPGKELDELRERLDNCRQPHLRVTVTPAHDHQHGPEAVDAGAVLRRKLRGVRHPEERGDDGEIRAADAEALHGVADLAVDADHLREAAKDRSRQGSRESPERRDVAGEKPGVDRQDRARPLQPSPDRRGRDHEPALPVVPVSVEVQNRRPPGQGQEEPHQGERRGGAPILITGRSVPVEVQHLDLDAPIAKKAGELLDVDRLTRERRRIEAGQHDPRPAHDRATAPTPTDGCGSTPSACR